MSKVVEQKISLSEVMELARGDYTYMIKGCADIVQTKMALGGEYHIESCELLQKTFGSMTADVWGFNIVFNEHGYEIEYDSLMNIKPEVNPSRIISDQQIQLQVKKVIEEFIG